MHSLALQKRIQSAAEDVLDGVRGETTACSFRSSGRCIVTRHRVRRRIQQLKAAGRPDRRVPSVQTCHTKQITHSRMSPRHSLVPTMVA